MRIQCGIKGENISQFLTLVDREKIKERILKSGDQIAKAIYREGRNTHPRTMGYVGELARRNGKTMIEYNLRNTVARKVNKSIFSELLERSQELRNRYEEDTQR